MYCKDCKFWDARFTDSGSGDCWLSDQVENCQSAVSPNGLAYYAHAYDDLGLESGIKTGPMFGCVNFVQSTKTSQK